MSGPAALQMLDTCLQSSAFLSGSEPTQVDIMAFQSLASGSPSYWQYRHLCLWFHRLNALTAEERKKLPGGQGVLAPQPAALSKMDKWILSRLAAAVTACNEGFEQYNFPQATTALYNFWLYELCDVYLECLKPVFQGTDSRAILTARNVLYTCLDVALRLISPMMPFISEELFQRLPRKSDEEPPSIMVTRYPDVKEFAAHRSEAVEAQVEFVRKIVSVVRSTRSDYNLPNKVKTDLYLQMFDGKMSAELGEYGDVIGTLAYASKVELTPSPPKSGCAIVTVSDKCSAHLVLKGLIDPGKEVEKLTKKRSLLESQVDKLTKAAQAEGYTTKVPEDVRLANSEKVVQSTAEIARLGEAMQALKAMM
jgi:valyl-tRNA synthetase